MLKLTVLLLIAVTRAEMDLFVMERYRSFSSWNESERCQAETCERPGCLALSPTYYLADTCYRTYDTYSPELNIVSEMYTLSNTTEICDQVYDDQKCQNLFTSYDNTKICSTIGCTPLNGSDSGSQQSLSFGWQLFNDFCVQSEQPVEPYVVPLVEARIYNNLSSCELSSQDYVNSYIPNDPTLCLPTAVAVGGVRVPGSYVTYCDGSKRISVFYSDSNCSEQSPEMMFPQNIVDGCTPGLEAENRDDPTLPRSTSTCGQTPLYYCKDLTTAGMGVKVASPSTSPLTSDAFAQAHGTDPIIMVSFFLACLSLFW
jgi:hypothetical protein